FGRDQRNGYVGSVWDDPGLVHALCLNRSDRRPGTTALLVGFYDPDQPERGLGGPEELTALASDLRAGVEENFWPLLTRGGLRVRIEIVDGGSTTTETVDPEQSYSELVRALRRFDKD